MLVIIKAMILYDIFSISHCFKEKDMLSNVNKPRSTTELIYRKLLYLPRYLPTPNLAKYFVPADNHSDGTMG